MAKSQRLTAEERVFGQILALSDSQQLALLALCTAPDGRANAIGKKIESLKATIRTLAWYWDRDMRTLDKIAKPYFDLHSEKKHRDSFSHRGKRRKQVRDELIAYLIERENMSHVDIGKELGMKPRTVGQAYTRHLKKKR